MSSTLKSKAGEPADGMDKKVRADEGDFEDNDLQARLELEVTAESIDETCSEDTSEDAEEEWPTQKAARHYVLTPLNIKVDNRSWTEIFLDFIDDEDMKNSIKDFVSVQGRRSHPKAIEDVDAFLSSTKKDWADHDPKITAYWSEFKTQLSELLGPEFDERFLVKPSGPLSAVLVVVWHYPTYMTKKQFWGHVMDKSNPSLQVQYRKIGPNRSVLTSNRIPIRKAYSRSASEEFSSLPNWDKIEEVCLKFQRDLNAESPFLIVVGTENNSTIERLVEVGLDYERVWVPINLNTVALYAEEPQILIVRHKDTGAIRQMVFSSFHSQTFYYAAPIPNLVAYHDLLWNAVLEFAGLYIKSENSFTTLVRAVEKKNHYRGYGMIKTAVYLRGKELQEKMVFPERVVREIFKKVFETEDVPPLGRSRSHVKRILDVWTNKGRMTQAASGWRNFPSMRTYYNTMAKIDALWNTKQVRQLLVKADRKRISFCEWCKEETVRNPNFQSTSLRDKLDIYESVRAPLSFFESRVLNLKRDYNKNSDCDKRFLGRHVVYYSEENPRGLRWEGDGGPENDDFDHDTEEHPAVFLGNVLTDKQKRRFQETGSFWPQPTGHTVSSS
ncbi:hypothetical protein DL764_002779 [Monosporascus ibericus]|uniref:Uncharacterized protein n=1 Tax=Monosporascus ibericus TaxID=155417 RepID=A0A4Q4TN80_9PEZI|nr:hypothetical protein DL764_002779 [Monosporascus ibericus]